MTFPASTCESTRWLTVPARGKDAPHVFAGGANGFLKMGQNIKQDGYSNQALNTIAAACGVKKGAGARAGW